LHFPSARAAQTLSGTLPSGARTFLPRVNAAAIAWQTLGAQYTAKAQLSKHLLDQ